MPELIQAHETTIRLTCFIALFLVLAVLERQLPRRNQHTPRSGRWSNHFALVILDSVLVRLLFPILAVGAAELAHRQSFGLLNWLDESIGLPAWLVFLAGFLLLDFAIYLQHRLFHHVPVLWRLHRMHHSDTEFDVSTGIRFHPAEILLSQCIKIAVVLLVGVPALAVLVFEIFLNATSLFNHSNLKISNKWDRALRLIIVTPDMHRVHHSVDRKETDSNFGFNLPWWDYLLGTYVDQPGAGHHNMTIGLEHYRSKADQRLDQLLVQPLRKDQR